MSASFLAASSQILVQSSPPFTALPFTVGLWVRPTTTGAFRSIWMLGANDVNNFWAIYQWNTDQFNLLCNAGGTEANALAGTLTSGSYVYIVARAISTTNRRISVLNVNGTASHAQETTSLTPSAPDRIHIGATTASGDFFSGDVAEYWCTNTDIQPDGAQLQDTTLRNLAYGGPFSMPNVGSSVLEYRSFRENPILILPNETAFGGKGIRTWTNTNAVTTKFSPSLPYSYVRPGQTIQNLVI